MSDGVFHSFTVKRSDKSREVDGAVNKVTWVTHQNRKEIEASDRVSLCEKSLLLAFSVCSLRNCKQRGRLERERRERREKEGRFEKNRRGGFWVH